MIDDSLPLTTMVFSWQTKGKSTISNQLIAGLIICESHEVYDCAIFVFKSVWAYEVNT